MIEGMRTHMVERDHGFFVGVHKVVKSWVGMPHANIKEKEKVKWF